MEVHGCSSRNTGEETASHAKQLAYQATNSPFIPVYKQFGLHLLLSLSSSTYSHHTSITRLVGSNRPSADSPTTYHPNAGAPGWAGDHTPWIEGEMVIPPSSIPKNHTDPNRRKANAAFVVLARNSDLWEFLDSMKQMEDRFNHWAGYDWVFLNEEPFDEKFKQYVFPSSILIHPICLLTYCVPLPFSPDSIADTPKP